jgi:hypothetical protein
VFSFQPLTAVVTSMPLPTAVLFWMLTRNLPTLG